MDNEYRIDYSEIMKTLRNAEVVLFRFVTAPQRLLIDFRTSDVDGPLVKMVPRAKDAEDRFKSLKKLRPLFPLPEKIMSFMWPRHIDTMKNSGVWEKIESRMVSLGGEPMMEQCQVAYRELAHQERLEVLSAIKGGEGYQSLWERTN